MNEQSCANCNAALFHGGNGSQGICRAHPPTVCVVLIPQGQVQMSLVPTPINAISSVARDGWCREWAPAPARLLGVN